MFIKIRHTIKIYHILNGACASVCMFVCRLVQWLNYSARGGGPKLEPEGPKAEVGFPTADQM